MKGKLGKLTLCVFLLLMCLGATAMAATLTLPSSLKVIEEEAFCGDSTAHKMSFGDFDASTLNNEPFRLRFHVSGKLYSFGLADENGDFGGAHAAGLVK